jgi:hypothetical protein
VDIDFIPSDIGLNVTGLNSGTTGKLVYYNNSSGYIIVDSTGGFTTNEMVQSDEIGAGTLLDAGFEVETHINGFVARPIGMSYPKVHSIIAFATGQIPRGKYIIGVEKVRRINGVDIVASSPNRFDEYGFLNVVDCDVSDTENKIEVTLKSSEFDDDQLWTHLKVWRTLNLNVNVDDKLNPEQAAGNNDELYLECIITRAEIYGTVGPIDTGTDPDGIPLPAGNANVEAGFTAGYKTVYLNNPDENLTVAINSTQLELIPLPPAEVGCYHANKIWVSAITDSLFNKESVVDDQSKNNLYYSNWAGTAYAEMFAPSQFVLTDKDGQKVTKLISFERDLIAIKEAKTMRLPDGNPFLPIETTDHSIGIKQKNLAKFIPQLGICAITNDYSDFRIYGFDWVWRTTLNGHDISRVARSYTKIANDADGLYVSIIYINGKIMIKYQNDTFLVLNVESNTGWCRYQYKFNNFADLVITNTAGSRAFVLSASQKLIEIEVENLDTDVDQRYQILELKSASYVNCIASDIGKSVVGATSTESGTLISYNNTTRKWTIQIFNTQFYTTSENISITAGTGAGKLLASNFQYQYSAAIALSHTTHKFQSNAGADVLEMDHLSIMAKALTVIQVTPFGNGLAWPVISSETKDNAFPSPSVHSNDAMRDREYRFYIDPAAISDFMWNRLICNFLHFKIETTAPALIRLQKLKAIIDEDGLAYGQFSPYQDAAIPDGPY